MKNKNPLYIIGAIVVVVIAIVAFNLPKNESQKVSKVSTQSTSISFSSKSENTQSETEDQVSEKHVHVADSNRITAEMKKYGSAGYFTVPAAIRGTWYRGFGGNVGTDEDDSSTDHDAMTFTEHSIIVSKGTTLLMKSVPDFNNKFQSKIKDDNHVTDSWEDANELTNSIGFGTVPWRPDLRIGKFSAVYCLSNVDGQPIIICREGSMGWYDVFFKSRSLAKQYSKGDKKNKVEKLVDKTIGGDSEKPLV